MPSDEAVSVTPKYHIGRVTKLTGLSIDVVRVWERRYGAVRPVRSDGGTRLYSDADVRRLRRLRQAVEGGHSISQAARLSESELDELIADVQPSIEVADPFRPVRERFLEAVRNLDVVEADQELARAAAFFHPRELAKNIVSPIIDEIGERSARKEFGMAHEQFAYGLLRSMMGSLFRLYLPSVKAETIVFATPAGERHELRLFLAALLAALKGWRVVILGADIPAAEIALAVRVTNARILVLTVTKVHTRFDEELATIARLIPYPTRIWLGGSEAAKHREFVTRANWILFHDLEELDDRLGMEQRSEVRGRKSEAD